MVAPAEFTAVFAFRSNSSGGGPRAYLYNERSETVSSLARTFQRQGTRRHSLEILCDWTCSLQLECFGGCFDGNFPFVQDNTPIALCRSSDCPSPVWEVQEEIRRILAAFSPRIAL